MQRKGVIDLKKRYTVNLNEESTEVVQAWLEKNGQTFSGWLTILVDEFAKEVQGQPSMAGKNPEEMTLKEFINVVNYWFKKTLEQ
jgi:hypothetical protein